MDKKFKQQLKKDYQGKSMLSQTNWEEELDDEFYEVEFVEKKSKKKKKKTWKNQDYSGSKDYRELE